MEKLSSNNLFCYQLKLHFETAEVRSPLETFATLCLFCRYAKAVVALIKYAEVQSITELNS